MAVVTEGFTQFNLLPRFRRVTDFAGVLYNVFPVVARVLPAFVEQGKRTVYTLNRAALTHFLLLLRRLPRRPALQFPILLPVRRLPVLLCPLRPLLRSYWQVYRADSSRL